MEINLKVCNSKDFLSIRDYYLNNGYAKAQITKTDVQLNDEKTKVNVTIDVNEVYSMTFVVHAL